MGREVLRVPKNFDWPMHKIWPGRALSICQQMEEYYPDEDDKCNLCKKFAGLANIRITNYGCPQLDCHEPPKGDWWQMWEDVSEGSPISPVFETPEELAKWLSDNNASAMGHQTATYEQWLGMIKGPGCCLSGVLENGVFKNGVEFASESKDIENLKGE